MLILPALWKSCTKDWRWLWKPCHWHPPNSANGPCFAALHCMQLTQPCPVHQAFHFLSTNVTFKYLINISEFVCTMRDYCCPCLTDGEMETDTLSWDHTMGWMGQSGLEFKTIKSCCHMVKDLESRQLKLWALNICTSTDTEHRKQADVYGPLLPVDGPPFARMSHISAQL